MNSRISVSELKTFSADKTVYETVLLLKSVQIKTAKNGKPFMRIELGDNTGAFSTTLFNNDPFYTLLETTSSGTVLTLALNIDFYNDSLSPKILQLKVLSPEAGSEWMAQLEMCAPIPIQTLSRELDEHITAIAHPELKQTVENALSESCGDALTLREALCEWPAAISMHHAYRHGLIEHTVRMLRAARVLLPLYPEIDPDLVMAGITLHDLGKIYEYTGILGTQKTREGILQGHVVLGYRIARKAGIKAHLNADLLDRLEHIILSHQGQLEWGAATLAATPEAVFVSMVDNLDAKMGMVQYALRTGPQTPDAFSERMPGLGTQLLLSKPVRE
jgi:3'-5' exoribonuclease